MRARTCPTTKSLANSRAGKYTLQLANSNTYRGFTIRLPASLCNSTQRASQRKTSGLLRCRPITKRDRHVNFLGKTGKRPLSARQSDWVCSIKELDNRIFAR